MNPQPEGTPVIRVMCVDDLPDITAALRMIIGLDASMVCVGCLSSANDLLAEVERCVPRPDVLILDATMPGRNPLAAMRELADVCPQTRAIIYSAHEDEGFIARAMRAGAWRCVSKLADPEALLLAVHEVAAGRARDR